MKPSLCFHFFWHRKTRQFTSEISSENIAHARRYIVRFTLIEKSSERRYWKKFYPWEICSPSIPPICIVIPHGWKARRGKVVEVFTFRVAEFWWKKFNVEPGKLIRTESGFEWRSGLICKWEFPSWDGESMLMLGGGNSAISSTATTTERFSVINF